MIVAVGSQNITNSYTWTGAANSDWFNPANWIPVGVPDGQAGEGITFSSGAVTLSAPVTINGRFNWLGGALIGSPLTISTDGVLVIGGNSGKYLQSSLTNGGAVIWAGGDIVLTNCSTTAGAIMNSTGAVWAILCDQTMISSCADTNAGWVNMGTVTKSASAGTTSVSIPFSNVGGTIDVVQGTFALSASTLFNGAVVDGNGAVMITGGSFTNQGSIAMSGGALLSINGSVTLNDPAGLSMQAGDTLQLGGDLLGNTRNVGQWQANGTLAFTSRAHQLEAMSFDFGNVTNGYVHNFAYGTISLASGAVVTLVDQFTNSAEPPQECVYATSLVVPSGSTLNLNGLHLYSTFAQISGTVTAGTISQTPTPGGPLTLGSNAPASLFAAGELEDFTFLGRSGEQVVITVDTGSASVPPPSLNYAFVQLFDPSTNLLAQASNTAPQQVVALLNVILPVDGLYTLAVRAPANQSASTGNYLVAVWDATPSIASLVVNQQEYGQTTSPYAVDEWNFSASAGEQVQFNLINVSSPGVAFNLSGPNGWVGFSNQVASSDLITLPYTGNYTLTAFGTGGAYGVAYSFELNQTAQTNLAVGSVFSGSLVGSGLAQLFTVTVTNGSPLQIGLTCTGAGNAAELYVKLGSPPTRGDYDFSSTVSGSSQAILIPLAVPGTYYVLVYGNNIVTPGTYSVAPNIALILLSSVYPGRLGNRADATLTLSGAGFYPGTLVSLVGADGTKYSATSLEINSMTSMSATFASNTVPLGVYSVLVTSPRGGGNELTNSFQFTGGGQPKLVTNLVVPGFLGRHEPATIYVQYSNAGEAAMPAPLLVLTGPQNPILALAAELTPDQQQAAFWSSTVPPPWATTLQFLASGQTPGVLQPGESMQVEIAYGGLLQPWNFSINSTEIDLGVLTVTNTKAINWSSLQSAMQPPTMASDAWNAVWQNFTAQAGSTWGSYLQALDNNAAYLGTLGLNVSDLGQLLAFQLEQADGLNVIHYLGGSVDASTPTPGLPLVFARVFPQNISARYRTGAFGRGWSHNWEFSLSTATDGTVTITGPAGSIRRFYADWQQFYPVYLNALRETGNPPAVPASGYFSSPGDYGQLSATGGGGFTLQEADGLVRTFGADGKLGYVADPNGNRITCGYTGSQLTSLSHSSGQQLSIAYNAGGTIASVTDPAGQQTSFSYDSSGEHLQTATYPGGPTATYTYTDAQTAAGNPTLAHALTEIGFPGGSHEYFGYDNQGRLASANGDGGAQAVNFGYTSGGTINITDAAANTASFFLDNQGLLERLTDPLGNSGHFAYDANFNLTAVTDPTGHSSSGAYDANGNLTQTIDASGNASRFTYQGPYNLLASLIDANGNATKFGNDSKGDLPSITYPDASQETWSYDSTGEPVDWTNRRGQTVRVTRDGDGQIIHMAYPDARTIDYAYDGRGFLTNVADSVLGVTMLAFDPRGLLTNIAYPDGNGFSFSYDDAGRRTSRTGFDGYTLNYGWDANGRLGSLTSNGTNLLVQYTYDPIGRLAREQKENGTSTTYAYDAAGQLVGMTNSAPDGTIQSFFNYTYDANGNRTSMTTAAGVTTYSYDALYQLIGVVYPRGRHVTYGYDPLGNRTMVNDTGTNTTYTANALNQYTQAGGTAFTYDADGNMTSQTDSSGTTTYQYDFENRLMGVATQPNGVWQYAYDGLGNRVAVVHNGLTNRYVNDPVGLVDVATEYDTSGALIGRYDHAVGLVARIDSSGVAAFYGFDALGNTRQLTGTGGAILNSYDYDAFGPVTLASESVSNAFRFVGRFGVVTDPTGLHFMRARFYSGAFGRFISQDPLSLGGGDINLYRYADGSPADGSDPSGLKWTWKWWWLDLPARAAWHGNYYGEYRNAGRTINPGEWYPLDPNDPRTWPTDTADWAAYYHDMWYHQGIKDAHQRAKDWLEQELKRQGRGPNWWEWWFLHYPLPAPPTTAVDSTTVANSASVDPNQLIGPAGYAQQNYVLEGSLFTYQILFENETNATAPAQDVTITDPLSTNLNWSTFALTAIAFGNTSILVPQGSQYFQTNIPFYLDGADFEVEIQAGINLANGQVFADFASIDPVTSLPPAVNIGFLPPEDGTGRGMGQVSYTVLPQPNLANGTRIPNVAFVQFDVNPVIATDQVNDDDPSLGISTNKQAIVTIDSTPPVSSVRSLPATETSGSFAVCWSGTDAGPGIVGYDIYVSTNKGPWAAWLLGTTNTCATFMGQTGSSYGFYSVAHDGAGNSEVPAGIAEATTFVAGGSSPVLAIALAGQEVLLSWPTNAGNFILQTTTNPFPQANWTAVTNFPSVVGSSNAVTLPIGGAAQFFRLRSQ